LPRRPPEPEHFSTGSVRPTFDPPKSGKIAVKVINHFGDEALKVYPVPTAKT
jgi:adenine-specific DNA-methyltransferase